MPRSIPVVDLFAGPGGLGEGFASMAPPYRIILSAEKEQFAHRTLHLRAFKRLLERHSLADNSFYDYLTGRATKPFDKRNWDAWREAGVEAQRLTLGEPDTDAALHTVLNRSEIGGSEWVLIGGPPCQAYSIVGRARNRGVAGYVAERDSRHYLYREYLKLIQEFRPAVFVMENVKGMLSSTVGGTRIFDQILTDLTDPDKALGRAPAGCRYRVHSLIDGSAGFFHGDDPAKLRGDEFTICSENFGIPQTRHRVILLGIRDDCAASPQLLHRYSRSPLTVRDAISDLPPVRSRLSRRADSASEWNSVVVERANALAREAAEHGLSELAARLTDVGRTRGLLAPPPLGGLRVPRKRSSGEDFFKSDSTLMPWYRDPKLSVVLNHDARGHMESDLGRYLYASCFAQCYGISPKSHSHFDLPSLAPSHRNWKTGDFTDRFRVQIWDEPGKTVTSHIHKDGHYFIHPDPLQCRSFTVREAARVQTFPDNYFFEGNRTQQYIQVGNAVPPLLARFIAEVVHDVIRGSTANQSRGETGAGVG